MSMSYSGVEVSPVDSVFAMAALSVHDGINP
jgi:hypothetical protein